MTILVIYDECMKEYIPVRIDENGFIQRNLSCGITKKDIRENPVISEIISTELFIEKDVGIINSKRRELYEMAEKRGKEKYHADIIDIGQKVKRSLVSQRGFFKKPMVKLELEVQMYYRR